jgi:hypothetical protein
MYSLYEKELRTQLNISKKFYGAPYKLMSGLLSPITFSKFQSHFKALNTASSIHTVLIWMATITALLSKETQLRIQLMSLGLAGLFTTAAACRKIYSLEYNVTGIPSFMNAMIRMEKSHLAPSNFTL